MCNNIMNIEKKKREICTNINDTNNERMAYKLLRTSLSKRNLLRLEQDHVGNRAIDVL